MARLVEQGIGAEPAMLATAFHMRRAVVVQVGFHGGSMGGGFHGGVGGGQPVRVKTIPGKRLAKFASRFSFASSAFLPPFEWRSGDTCSGPIVVIST
jgi:hypothetical protein